MSVNSAEDTLLDKLEYATFLRRACAHVLDRIIVFCATVALVATGCAFSLALWYAFSPSYNGSDTTGGFLGSHIPVEDQEELTAESTILEVNDLGIEVHRPLDAGKSVLYTNIERSEPIKDMPGYQGKVFSIDGEDFFVKKPKNPEKGDFFTNIKIEEEKPQVAQRESRVTIVANRLIVEFREVLVRVGLAEETELLLSILLLGLLLVEILYFSSCEWSSFQGTPGKKLLGMVVIDQNGRGVTFHKALGRSVLRLVLLLSIIGFFSNLSVIFSRRRQSPHDLLTRTYVALRG